MSRGWHYLILLEIEQDSFDHIQQNRAQAKIFQCCEYQRIFPNVVRKCSKILRKQYLDLVFQGQYLSHEKQVFLVVRFLEAGEM